MSPEKERKTLLLPPVLHPSLALGTCLRSILNWHCYYYIQSKSLSHTEHQCCRTLNTVTWQKSML